ncbi:GNAT family N-acetyltransferase [Candidatus Pelagibacter sp.]|nr:GNAT family N-acetyltransferase [Candidatus Pelagibacter sp.]
MIKICLIKVFSKAESFLLQIRNNPEVRSNSKEMGEISPKSHKKWIMKCYQNPNIRIFVIKNHNEKIGYIRENKMLKTKYLSWALIKKYHGKGIMTECLKKISFNKKFTYKALIKKKNISSLKVAKKAGFRLVNKEINDLLYVKF